MDYPLPFPYSRGNNVSITVIYARFCCNCTNIKQATKSFPLNSTYLWDNLYYLFIGIIFLGICFVICCVGLSGPECQPLFHNERRQ